MGRLQRQNACTNRRQFGAIRTEPGNPRLRRTAWWGWEDSNFQPNDYQPSIDDMRNIIRAIAAEAHAGQVDKAGAVCAP
jgi:hypothetical protein